MIDIDGGALLSVDKMLQGKYDNDLEALGCDRRAAFKARVADAISMYIKRKAFTSQPLHLGQVSSTG